MLGVNHQRGRPSGLHPLVIGFMSLPVTFLLGFFIALRLQGWRYRRLMDEYGLEVRDVFVRTLNGETGLVEPVEPVRPGLPDISATLVVAAVLTVLVVLAVLLHRSRTTGVPIGAQLIGGLFPPPPAGFSALLALGAGVTSLAFLFDVGKLWAYRGMSQDDIAIAMEEHLYEVAFSLLLPIDFVALGFMVLAWLLHRRVKRTPYSPALVSGFGFWLAVAVFVFSFFKASLLAPLLSMSMGSSSAQFSADHDVQIVEEGEAAISDVESIRYQIPGSGSEVRRATGTVTNAGVDNWEKAIMRVEFLDDAATVCLTEHLEVPYIAAGMSRDFSTPKMSRPEYSSATCEPTQVKMTLMAYDLDSRSNPDPVDYASEAAPIAAVVVEEDHVAGNVFLSVAGEIPEAAEPSPAAVLSGMDFEVMDAQGIRLDWCFRGTPVEGDPGRFQSKRFHSPVAKGVYVEAVAAACG